MRPFGGGGAAGHNLGATPTQAVLFVTEASAGVSSFELVRDRLDAAVSWFRVLASAMFALMMCYNLSSFCFH